MVPSAQLNASTDDGYSMSIKSSGVKLTIDARTVYGYIRIPPAACGFLK